MTPASSPKIKDYLLGRLTAEQETELEEQYFADAECVAELWAVFGDFSEQYLRGELTPSDRADFEHRLRRSPAMREMFENEKALFDCAQTKTDSGKLVPPVKSAWHSRWVEWLRIKPLRFATLSALALLALGWSLGWWMWQAKNSAPPVQDQVAVLPPTPTPTPSVAPSATPLPQATATPPPVKPAAFASFFLPVQSLRSGANPPTLSFPRQTQTVRLDLELTTGDFAAYSAVLLSETSETLREWKRLSPQHSNTGNRIALHLPAALLTHTNYTVKLKPIDGTDGEAFTQQFRFSVVKR